MRYAQSEQKNIELQDKLLKADTKLKDATKEVETLKSKLKTVVAEKQKYQETLENRVNITLKPSYFCILNKVLTFLNNLCNLSLATVCI
jgi:flagellar biosynthesis chaperone FliJ